VILAGCGFLGGTAAGLFCARGWDVLGLCATEETAASRKDSPYEVRAVDISGRLALGADWRDVDILVHCASSGGGGVGAYRAVYFDGLQNLMEAASPRRVVFVSSTSVYGQSDGSWVDEESPAEPAAETGHVLRTAEDVAMAAGGVVLRLAGLYGPGRSVLLKKYFSGTAILERRGRRWINQIHRDDAAEAVFLAFSLASGIYNVCDDMPATQRTVYGWIARSLGGELPPEGEAHAPRKRGNTDKRVSNARLRAAGWVPQFSSYRKALPQFLAAGKVHL
jgi:nucleoside-diphosphate-sugar epimerase